MLKGYIFKEQTFNNEVCALIFNEYLNNQDGIFGNYKNGMAVTKSGSNVTIANGIGIIKGRAVGEDSSTTLDAGTAEMYCKLVIEIDLDKVNTSSSFLQASYKILKSSSAYPSLTQDNIIGTNAGVYQYEMARFKTTANGITDFEDKRTFLDIPTIYEQVVQMVQDAIDSIEDGSAFVTKIRYEGTVLYENATGTTGNVSLNDTITNYEYLDIFFYRADNDYGHIRIDAIQENTINLMTSFVGGSGQVMQIGTKRVKLESNRIKLIYEYFINLNANGVSEFGTQSTIYIYKVIGYK